MQSEAGVLPDIEGLAGQIRQCRICGCASARPLPHEPRPILRISATTRIVIASQAPGARAHASGVPFDDASGVRLRRWMGTSPELFYDADQIGIVPMGFCFPGYDAKGGDKAPRPECRAHWHASVFAALPQVELVICIGLHAARYHLERLDLPPITSMAALMAQWRALFAARQRPRLFPLPHPSWRNTGWLNRNPWFEAEVIPALQAEVRRLTTGTDAAPHSGPVQITAADNAAAFEDVA